MALRGRGTKRIVRTDLPLAFGMTRVTPWQCFLYRLKCEGRFQEFRRRAREVTPPGHALREFDTPSRQLAHQEFGYQGAEEVELYEQRWRNYKSVIYQLCRDEFAFRAAENEERNKLMAKIEAETKGKPKRSYADDVRWLYENWARVIQKDPGDGKYKVNLYALKKCPSKGIVTLAEWAKDNQGDFLTKLCAKYLVEKKEEGNGTASEQINDDPGRDELDEFMKQFNR